MLLCSGNSVPVKTDAFGLTAAFPPGPGHLTHGTLSQHRLRLGISSPSLRAGRRRHHCYFSCSQALSSAAQLTCPVFYNQAEPQVQAGRPGVGSDPEVSHSTLQRTFSSMGNEETHDDSSHHPSHY